MGYWEKHLDHKGGQRKLNEKLHCLLYSQNMIRAMKAMRMTQACHTHARTHTHTHTEGK
jgi:hypothetical protein